MDRYRIGIRNMASGTGRSLAFQADDFAHAEEQAEPYVEEHEEIIRIEKNYDVYSHLKEEQNV
jgi:hypothetical protein